jgi:predicted transcriptional regulator
MAKRKKGPIDPVLAELTAIKRLMVFALLRSGAKQEDVGRALGLNKSNVSRMFPGGIGKVAKGTAKGE